MILPCRQYFDRRKTMRKDCSTAQQPDDIILYSYDKCNFVSVRRPHII